MTSAHLVLIGVKMLVFTKEFTYSPNGVTTKTVKKGEVFETSSAHSKRIAQELIQKGILKDELHKIKRV